MKLLTIGDSFTYGEELSDRNKAWPHILGKLLDYEVTNLGQPGCSNNAMVRTAIEHSNEYDLIVVAWSHFARQQVADENGTWDVWPGSNDIFFTGDLKYRKELIHYVSRYHSDDFLYNEYVINVILLQKYLESQSLRYVMLDSFGNHQCEQRNTNSLISQVNQEHFLGWPNESMMEWAYGTPKGPSGHFLEQGHQLVAEKINEHI